MADAYDRYTRTPITFAKPEGLQGKTDFRAGLIEKLSSLFSGQPPSQQIFVDPKAENGSHNVMRHEIAHAILNRLGNTDQPLTDLNKSISVYPQIAEAFGRAGFKNPNTEVPAYAASGELQNLMGQKKEWQDEYINKLHENLMRANPQIAKWYQSLSAPTLEGTQNQ